MAACAPELCLGQDRDSSCAWAWEQEQCPKGPRHHLSQPPGWYRFCFNLTNIPGEQYVT